MVFFVVGDGGFHPIKTLLVLVRVVQLAVTRSSQKVCFSSARSSGVENGNLFWVVMASRKRSTSASCSKAAAWLYLEELVQIKGKFLRFAVDLHPLLDFVPDDLGHLVGVEVEHGEVCVGVLLPRCALPVPLGGLLVGVSPVEDGIPGKLIVRQRLEGRAGQVQRELGGYGQRQGRSCRCPRPRGLRR